MHVVHEVLQLDPYRADVLRCRRQHPIDAVDAEYRLFHASRNPFFHLGGRSAGIGHGDGDYAGVHGRENLRRQLQPGQQPAGQHQRHQQIGGNRVLGEVGHQALLQAWAHQWRCGVRHRLVRGRGVAGRPHLHFKPGSRAGHRTRHHAVHGIERSYEPALGGAPERSRRKRLELAGCH